MKKILKPASLLFNLLMVIVFLFVGIYIAGLVGAGEGQMLAGGAIVLMWGLMFAGVAFIASFFITAKTPHKTVVRLNWLLLVVLLVLYGITHYRYVQRQKEKEKEKEDDPIEKSEPATPTEVAPNAIGEPMALLSPSLRNRKTFGSPMNNNEPTMGMGYFIPNFYENQTLYFYGNLNLEKSIMEHSPLDSITFRRNKYNQFEITTAPPWLVPEVMKLDYDLLYFRIKSISQDVAEVVVNDTNGRTSFVDRKDGEIRYWPDFLLGVNSVEFLPDSNEKVRARPFESAETVTSLFEFMRPLRIQNDWMQVLLVDGDFETKGIGWIRWSRDGELLILHNLLS